MENDSEADSERRRRGKDQSVVYVFLLFHILGKLPHIPADDSGARRDHGAGDGLEPEEEVHQHGQRIRV